ncbi:YaeQ family protein [Pseudohongiella sp.]|uniref:YaeQ family protein n=1 Tax=marine sediment metagenome TaxID=412755 RepID=A0A0F9YVY3_9ZZZZ|nr:YaeQ family protein [Pseudohongiella sp.]HDZ07952.1 YaeQ family protein [Pseudohongiella sp.]HEA64441.1 YaeQ family protein [Pseudohongiella sp.]
MAAKSTIFKATLHVSDMERHYYQEHTLTLARHPSETDERMMVRLLAFALNAHERLEFGRGLSTEDEADLWQKDLTGAIEHWIDVGMPDERLVRKACGRSQQVTVYCYGGRIAEMWAEQNNTQFARQTNLRIINLLPEHTQALAALAQRSMTLHCLVQDGLVSFSDDSQAVELEPVQLYPAP